MGGADAGPSPCPTGCTAPSPSSMCRLRESQQKHNNESPSLLRIFALLWALTVGANSKAGQLLSSRSNPSATTAWDKPLSSES
jgi:hypothetical protein